MVGLPHRASWQGCKKIYRRSESFASWRSGRFYHVRRVGIPHDLIVVRGPLAQQNVEINDRNFNVEQQIDKLLRGRFDLLISIASNIGPLIAAPNFKSHVEELPKVFMIARVYLAFSPQYLARASASANAMWREVVAVKHEIAKCSSC